MDDGFGSFDASAFEDHGVGHHCRLDVFMHTPFTVLRRFQEFSDQVLEDEVSCDSLGQELVEHGTDGAQLGRALLHHHFLRNISHKSFVVRAGSSRLVGQVRSLQFDGLKHHNSSSHVSAGTVC